MDSDIARNTSIGNLEMIGMLNGLSLQLLGRMQGVLVFLNGPGSESVSDRGSEGLPSGHIGQMAAVLRNAAVTMERAHEVVSAIEYLLGCDANKSVAAADARARY